MDTRPVQNGVHFSVSGAKILQIRTFNDFSGFLAVYSVYGFALEYFRPAGETLVQGEVREVIRGHSGGRRVK
jgi:hypothetical protein